MRIVCLTDETVETLYALGASDLIVGISGFTNRPPEARKTKPRVSTFSDANYDEIEALRPDVVLAWSDVQANITADLVRRGIDVVCFNQRSVAGILEMIRRLGGYVGLRDRAERYAAELAARVEAAAERGARRTVRPRVYFEEWDDPLVTGIRWVSEIIAICGGQDVFEERSRFPASRDRIIDDPLEPVRRDPDILVASWCGKLFKPGAVRARPGWEQFRPAETGELHEIDSSVILQPGPAALTDGIDAMMAIFDAWEVGDR